MKNHIVIGCLMAGLFPGAGSGTAEPAAASVQTGGGIEKAAGLGARTGASGVPSEAPQTPPPRTQPPAPPAIHAAPRDAPGVRKAADINDARGATAPPPPPPAPPSSVVKSGGLTSGGDASNSKAAGSIRPVRGLSGITAPKIQNLEAALLIKRATPPPDAPLDRKSKAAAARLMSGPGDKVDPKGVRNVDGRGGFQEFEKLDKSGS
jgi:hypothetical protein